MHFFVSFFYCFNYKLSKNLEQAIINADSKCLRCHFGLRLLILHTDSLQMTILKDYIIKLWRKICSLRAGSPLESSARATKSKAIRREGVSHACARRLPFAKLRSVVIVLRNFSLLQSTILLHIERALHSV